MAHNSIIYVNILPDKLVGVHTIHPCI